LSSENLYLRLKQARRYLPALTAGIESEPHVERPRAGSVG
jgi:hypothetical protein